MATDVEVKLDEKNDMFQHLVLTLLWTIILILLKRYSKTYLGVVRQSCITFGDLYSHQSEDAKHIRRTITYPHWEVGSQ